MKHPFRRGLALLSAVVLGVGASAMPLGSAKPLKAEAATADVLKIACVGCSTTLGAGGNGTSWPSELGKLLGGLCEVKNYGENSRTVLHDGVEWDDVDHKNNLAYTRTPQYEKSLAYAADIVLIMMGANDSKPINWRDGNNTFEEDYRALVEAYQKANENTKVIVVIEPWIRGDGAFTITEEVMASGVRPAYTKVAQEMGLDTIDLYTPTKGHNEWYSDNVHSNAAGYTAMAKVIAERMREMNLIPEGSESTPIPFRPESSVGDFYGEFDGCDVMQWKDGETGYFQFVNGALAAKMGIDKKTVVKNLTINVSYYWDATAAGNDWWHFNTTDKTGQSAPSVDGSNPHDNGFGTFAQYGMKMRQWDVLTVSRDDQTFGGDLDWSVSVGSLDAKNSLYIRGYEVTATLDNGTIKSYKWGTLADRRAASDGKTLKIACVGASLTSGNNVPEDRGTTYPAYLQMMLGSSCEVREFGHPGARVITGDDWSYMTSKQDQWKNKYADSLAYMADVVIIDLGDNDAVRGFFTKEKFLAGYEELIKSYLNQGNDPLIVVADGTYKREDIRDWKDANKMMEQEIMPLVSELANKYGLTLFNLNTIMREDPKTYIGATDGEHYTAAGYKKEAQELANILRPMLQIPEEDNNSDAICDPPHRSIPIGEYDGYRCLMWENGTGSGFNYISGSLASEMGIDEGTVVKNLSIEVSYYWDAAGASGGNDWWHFNTTDKDGLSAPSVSGDNPHDNGFGTFPQYGMKRRQWSTFTVSRDEQMLGGNGTDWSVNVGSLESKNSLYIRGYQVTATLDDGTQKVANWGTYAITVDKVALNAAIADEVADLTPYTKASADAYSAALTAAKAVAADENATQEQVDAAMTALAEAKEALVMLADKTALKDAIADEVTDFTPYIKVSVDAYTAALTAAKAVDADENATQEQVDVAEMVLIHAKETLALLGDVNEDGKVDSGDALQLLRYAAEIITYKDINMDAAELNGDGKVDSGDALLSLQYAAEIITEFPAGK